MTTWHWRHFPTGVASLPLRILYFHLIFYDACCTNDATDGAISYVRHQRHTSTACCNYPYRTRLENVSTSFGKKAACSFFRLKGLMYVRLYYVRLCPAFLGCPNYCTYVQLVHSCRSHSQLSTSLKSNSKATIPFTQGRYVATRS